MYNGHLSIEQIESLSQQESQSSRQQNSEDWSHVEDCDRCRSLVEKCRLINARLGKLASTHFPTRSAMTCPDQKTWFEVAAGALPDEESLQYLEHAAECDDCGKILKTSLRILNEPLTKEDELLLDEVPGNGTSTSSGSEKLKDAIRKIFHFKVRHLSYAIAGLVTVALITWGSLNLYQHHQVHVAKELLAAEYKQWRPTEYRLADLPYGPVRSQQGPTQKRHIFHFVGHGLDPQSRAAAALLELDSASAIQILKDAKNSPQAAKAVLQDLVVAYAVDYRQTGSKQSMDDALASADEVIQKYPDDPVGYFNRGVIYTNRACPDCPQKARKDFQQVLSLDHDSNWVHEAENYLLRRP